MSNITIDAVCTKGLIYPMLIDFENGFPKEDFGITCAVVLQDKDRSRTVATELSEQVYAGKEKKEAFEKTFVLARNRITGKTRLIEMGNVELEAFTKADLDYLEEQQEEERSKLSRKKYTELLPVKDSVTTQVNRGITLEKTESDQCTIMPIEMAISEFGVTTDIEKSHISDNVTGSLIDLPPVKEDDDLITPPFNKEATRLEDIYSIEKILSTQQYSQIYYELREKSYSESLHPHVRYLIQDKNLSPTLIVLSVYASEILKILQCNKLIKEGPIMVCPSKTLANLLEKKLENLSKQGYENGVGLLDRLVCDAIVLLLIMNGFELRLGPLCDGLQLAQIEKIICLVGASIVNVDGAETVVLRLPLARNCHKQQPSNTIELSMNNKTEEKIYNFNNITDQEIKMDLQNQTAQGKNGLNQLNIQSGDKEATDWESLQNETSAKKRIKRSSNVKDNSQTDLDEKENWNQNLTVNKLDVSAHKNDLNGSILNVYILPGNIEASVVESVSFHQHTFETKNIEYKSKEYENKTENKIENYGQIDSEEKKNGSHDLITDQLDISHDENGLDELYILPRNREGSEDESNSLNQQQGNMFEMKQTTLKHKKRNRGEKVTGGVETDLENAENENCYDGGLHISAHDKNDGDDLNIPPIDTKATNNDLESLHRYENNLFKLRKKSKRNNTKKGCTVKDDFETHSEDVRNSNSNITDEQLDTAVNDNNDSDHLYILPRDIESTGDDSEFLQQHGNSALELRKKSKKNIKRKREKAKDENLTESKGIENDNLDITSEKFYVSVDDGYDLDDLYVLPRFKDTTEDDSESWQQHRKSKKNKKRKREKAGNEDPTDSIDLYMQPRERETTEDDSEPLQQLRNSALEVRRNSKNNKKRKTEQELDNVQTDATLLENNNANVNILVRNGIDDHDLDNLYIQFIEKETTEDVSDFLHKQHNNIALEMKRKPEKYKMNSAEETKDDERERETTEHDSDFLPEQHNKIALETERKPKKHIKNNAEEKKGDERERETTEDDSDFKHKQHIEMKKKSKKYKKNNAEDKKDDERERETTEDYSDFLREQHNNTALESKRKPKKHKKNNAEESKDDELANIEEITAELNVSAHDKTDLNDYLLDVYIVPTNVESTLLDIECLQKSDCTELVTSRKSKKLMKNEGQIDSEEIKRGYPNDATDFLDVSVHYDNDLGDLFVYKLPRNRKATDNDSIFL